MAEETKKKTKKKGGPGRPFEKGNPGGPGRPKDTYYQKIAKGKVKKEFFAFMAKYWDKPLDEAAEMLKTQDMSMGERMFLKWFLNRVKEPTNADMEALARMLGINLNKLEITHTNDDGNPFKVEFVTPSGEKDLRDGLFKGYTIKKGSGES